MFGEAHPLGQDDTEAVKKRGLDAVRLSDAAQADLAMRRSGQYDVVRADACEFLENGTRRVTETGALLPHLQALPQHESQEADEDVGLNAIRATGARSDADSTDPSGCGRQLRFA